jgi:hypothetical protein
MRIGLDEIRGQQELCLLAIGTGQPIGRCVGRDPRSGRLVSLTRRLPVGAYTEAEPVELERRPNPRPAPAVAVRIVVALTLAVVVGLASAGATAVTLAGRFLPAAARVARAIRGYWRREFAEEWRLALTLAPFAGFLVWLALR